MSTVLPVASRALVAACKGLGLDPAALFARSGVPASALDDVDARLPAESADAIWRAAFELSQDPLLALRAAEATPYGAFRVIDFLGATAPTIGEGMRRVTAYFRLVDPRGVLSVEEHGDRVGLVFRGTDGRPLPNPAQQYTLAILATRMRREAADVSPVEVRFTFSAPADVSAYRRIFGLVPRFDSDVAALFSTRADWERPTTAPDPALFSTLDDHARSLLARAPGTDDLVTRVRAAIGADLAGEDPSLAAVSRRLAMSSRSLQRRLSEHGTSFGALVDEVRRERAFSFLRARDVSIAEAAWLLGFSEQSAFTRAFRRWTGSSPSDFRKKAR